MTVAAVAAEIINGTHDAGGRVFCVGTTTVRVLETCNIPGTRHVAPGSGATSIFLYPPYRASVPDCLLTNFHLPQSSLIVLVAALCGRKRILDAYAEAVKEEYRFFSYGDAMFVR